MKKYLVGSSILCSILLMSGCQTEHNQFISPVVEAKSAVNFYDISYKMNVSSNENKVDVALSIENNGKNAIPLLTSKGKLFSVKLKRKDGTVIDEKIVDLKDRKQILSNENVNWNVEFEANMDKELIVEAKLLLKPSKYQKYQIVEKDQSVPVAVSSQKLDTTNVIFTPNLNKLYTYKDGNNNEIKEHITFFNGNKVQTFSDNGQVDIYSQEPDGIYDFNAQDPVGDIDGTGFVDKKDMNLLIPLPIQEGFTWNVGDKKYILSDADVPVKTDLGLFDHCIEVTEISGDQTRYIYYKQDIGLLKVKLARPGQSSLVELQLVSMDDIQTPATTDAQPSVNQASQTPDNGEPQAQSQQPENPSPQTPAQQPINPSPQTPAQQPVNPSPQTPAQQPVNPSPQTPAQQPTQDVQTPPVNH